jgi:hypothetical protein
MSATEEAMQYDNVGSEEQATAKLSVALPANPRAAIRPMELCYIVGFFFLFAIYLDATDVSDQVIAERRAQIEGCIAQYAAGERYAKPKPPKCAPMVEANHVLTLPLGAQ